MQAQKRVTRIFHKDSDGRLQRWHMNFLYDFASRHSGKELTPEARFKFDDSLTMALSSLKYPLDIRDKGQRGRTSTPGQIEAVFLLIDAWEMFPGSKATTSSKPEVNERFGPFMDFCRLYFLLTTDDKYQCKSPDEDLLLSIEEDRRHAGGASFSWLIDNRLRTIREVLEMPVPTELELLLR